MKTLKITLFTFILFFFTQYILTGQVSQFTSINCGISSPAPHCDDGVVWLGIEVDNQGVLGADNLGITSVFIDVDQASGFDGTVILITPNGEERILASSEEGFGSFPGYTGTNTNQNNFVNVNFENCSYNIETTFSGEPGGMTFSPIESFNDLNDGISSADGLWLIQICSLNPVESLSGFCASIDFGPLCPEIINATVTDANCPNSPYGSVIFDTNFGACSGEVLLYSINGVDWQDSNTFDNIPSGVYIGSVGIQENPNGGGGNSNDVYCISEYAFVVTSNDQQVPTWIVSTITGGVECGVGDLDAVAEDFAEGLFGIDNCNVVTYEQVGLGITYNCGNSQFLDYSYELKDAAGNTNASLGHVYISVFDETGPVISGVPADMTINCNDPFPDLPNIGPSGVTALDVCNGDVSTLVAVSATSIAGDCNQGQAVQAITYLYEANDGCGNFSSEGFTISIFNDEPPALELPYIIDEIQVVTIECGVDDVDATIAANLPSATGCSGGITPVVDWTIDVQSCSALSNSITKQIDYLLEDECGNFVIALLDVVYADTQAPIINGIPANITINCNDTPPPFPNITADDVCEGDVTSLIDYELDVTSLSCDINTNAIVETHTWVAKDYCENEQSATWTVTIFNDESVDLGSDITACTGDDVTISTSGLNGTYLWSTGATTPEISVDQAGSYYVTVTGVSGCCSIDEVEVNYQDIPDVSVSGGAIDCSGAAIIISGSSTAMGVTYAWVGPGGYTSIDQNPLVSQTGTYTLTVSTSAGCTATADAQVTANTDAPDITTVGGVIDCINSSAIISGSSTTTGVTYTWSGPNGYSSTMQNPTVDVPGNYELTISATNGCIAEGVAVVEDDTAIPVALAVGGTVDCNNNDVTIMTETTDTNADFVWTGPGGYSSTEMNPTVSIEGLYTLTITSSNGCTNMTTASVILDTAMPNLTAVSGEVDCNNTSIQITASSTTSGVSYQWTGPNGFSSDLSNPSVDLAGDYVIVIEATNGCTNQETITVTENTSQPPLMVNDEEINCNNTAVILMAVTDDNVSYAWTGPNGFVSNQAEPMTAIAGEYMLTVTALNGCINTEILNVTEDITVPMITVSDALINCSNPSAQLIINAPDNNLIYEWSGPNNFESDEQSPTVDVSGVYTAIAIADNGCTSSQSVTVTEDINVPDASAIGGGINCADNTVQISGSSSTTDVTYTWIGPNDFTANIQNPDVGTPGTYTLIVTSANGCTSVATAIVTADADLPNVMASGGELDCKVTEVQLQASSSTPNVTYVWMTTDGAMINEQNPTVDEAGIYTLTVTSENGCSSETQVTVTLDDSQPTVIALGGEVSCSQSSITLVSNSEDNVTYEWSGPNGFTSDEQNPEVTEPGIYTLTVTGENGCGNETSVVVEADDNLPIAAFADPTIDCDENELTLTIESVGVYNYQWVYNGSVISTGQSVVVDEAGEYSVVVTSNNGCSISLGYTLNQDVVEVQADIFTTNATGDEGGTAIINVDNLANVVGVIWDNGQTGIQATDLSIGVHTVTVTSIYGCSYTFDFEIVMSTAVGEIENLEMFQVYPTMFREEVYVEAELAQSSDVSIKIVDKVGQVVSSSYLSSKIKIDETIDLNELVVGVYFIVVEIDGHIKTTKLIKM